MALNKVIYVDGVTVITAENMNAIQDAIIALEETPAQGLTEDMKQALLQIARKVAYIDDQGQTYYDDLYDALYPPKTVVLITAVFNQGTTVIYDDTALDDLKQYLTVTAKYDDNTTAILADSAYTLSGLLEAGTSTVTVAYNGLTTTFTVNVTARPTLSSISAVYTQSGTVYDTDTLDSLKPDLVVTANYSDSSTQTVPAADYTLSGTLTAGKSTITVSYGGKTATFSVVVTSSILYQLTNYSVDKTSKNSVDSGIALCETDQDFTIVFDGIQTAAIPTGKSIRLMWLMSDSTTPQWKGIFWGTNASGRAYTPQWMTAEVTNKTIYMRNASTARFRLVYTHAKNSDAAILYQKVNDNEVHIETLNATFLQQNSTLIVGGANATDPTNNWIGTITNCTIYKVVLSQEQIDSIMS